jgi:cell wall-associated NlpC family hydrolase
MRIIGPAFNAAERAAAITAARGCLGVPWRHMGRAGLPWGHSVGLDCIGLIGVAVHAAGRRWRDQAYGTEPNGTLLPLMDEHLGDRTGPDVLRRGHPLCRAGAACGAADRGRNPDPLL